MTAVMGFAPAQGVELGGLLGRALAANRSGRLSHFVVDENSPAIALFSPQHVMGNEQGDWYGEHAGKWLCAAAKAARRTGDATLRERVRRVADYLVDRQDADGYLGTYAPSRRFMHEQPPASRTWDGAPALRTWDIWTHSYLILGMLEAGALLGGDRNSTPGTRHPAPAGNRYVECARRIADLCWRTFTDGGIDVTTLGNHHGMSATVLIDPAVELFLATGEQKYLDLARLVLEQANRRPELRLLTAALAGVDVAEIGTGKAYQLCWNFVGIAKLCRATRDAQLLDATRNVWESIRRHHLTLGGGPWGGVAHRSREVFNPQGVFSPHGYVETCSTYAWVLLNRELLAVTGEARYAEEIERAAYNDLLGAQAPNGEDWCYYSFPNGKRVFTTYWRCCKSSGALALEELPAMACGLTSDGIAVNLYGDADVRVATAQAGAVRLTQITRYPFAGDVRIVVAPERSAQFTILLRVPAWAEAMSVRVNGVDAGEQGVARRGYVALDRTWQKGDEISLAFAMPPVLHARASRNVQESKGPAGEPVSQEVMHYDYVAITRGPLVYATGLIDGFKAEETLCLQDSNSPDRNNPDRNKPDRNSPAGRLSNTPLLELVEAPPGFEGPAIRMNVVGRAPITFTPYFEAGGREDGAWRLTWMQLAPTSRGAAAK